MTTEFHTDLRLVHSDPDGRPPSGKVAPRASFAASEGGYVLITLATENGLIVADTCLSPESTAMLAVWLTEQVEEVEPASGLVRLRTVDERTVVVDPAAVVAVEQPGPWPTAAGDMVLPENVAVVHLHGGVHLVVVGDVDQVLAELSGQTEVSTS